MDRVKRLVLILTLGLFGALLSGAVIKPLWPGIIVPNILIILLVHLGFYEISGLGALLAFVLGLEFDLCSPNGLLGPWAGASVLVYGAVVFCSQRMFIQSGLVVFVTVFFASLLSCSIYVTLVYWYIPIGTGILTTASLEALVTAVFAPPLFKLFQLFVPQGEPPLRHSYAGIR